MEKRKVFAVIMSAILALSLTACGAVTVTTAQSEPQPAAEVETPTPTPVEEPEVTPEPTKEPEVEEVVKEPVAEEPETIVEEPKEMTPMEALLDSNMSEYITDGVFDADKFAKDTGASFWWFGTYDNPIYGNLIFGYGEWFIQLGSDEDHPDINFVATGNEDESNVDRPDLLAYSYIFPSSSEVIIRDEDEEFAVSTECIIHLQDIFNLVSKNGVDATPNVLGTNFKPCDSADETIQY